ncbi:hypothetical protein A8C58_14825 [Enterococcus faecium]|nr:hypothetical protein A8C58_14825 [Enterococcus faecium]
MVRSRRGPVIIGVFTESSGVESMEDGTTGFIESVTDTAHNELFRKFFSSLSICFLSVQNTYKDTLVSVFYVQENCVH